MTPPPPTTQKPALIVDRFIEYVFTHNELITPRGIKLGVKVDGANIHVTLMEDNSDNIEIRKKE